MAMIDSRIRWSPRVPKWKLKRLYQQTSLGIYDEDLIDDVGMILYERCQDILMIHQAKMEKKVTCPGCLAEGRTTLVDRQGPRDEAIHCPVCGWEMSWPDYQRSFKRRQLNPGGAVIVFENYIESYRKARSPRNKILAIDLLIHEFHYSLREEPDRPTRPVGVNFIVGNLGEVVAFLDALSGIELPEMMKQTDADWREKVKLTYWPQYLESKDDDGKVGDYD